MKIIVQVLECWCFILSRISEIFSNSFLLFIIFFFRLFDFSTVNSPKILNATFPQIDFASEAHWDKSLSRHLMELSWRYSCINVRILLSRSLEIFILNCAAKLPNYRTFKKKTKNYFFIWKKKNSMYYICK